MMSCELGGHQVRSVSREPGERWSAVEPVIEMVSPVSPVSVKRIPSTGTAAVFNKTYIRCARRVVHMGGGRRSRRRVAGRGKTVALRNVENDPKLSYDYVSITSWTGRRCC